MSTPKKKRESGNLRLRQPDRSGPSEKTLLEIAQERHLFDQAESRRHDREPEAGNQHVTDEELAIGGTKAEHVMDTILWSISLTMLHFTLDVLVQHQYAQELSWSKVITDSVRALVVFFCLFYVLHPHPSSPTLVPGLPERLQEPLRQMIFFAMSVFSGCHLIYITNTYGYVAVLQRSPPLGCLWVWSVMELNLTPAALSLACAGAFLWYGGYKVK